ncbi:putative L,D-transpeptidase YbiS [Methylobacterium symbioticum]|uniref:Putative L,D-transpeptidase YbiS n=3 Tax=Methylobacterium TaxID=407 RepID=A0A509EGU0_9HYPH|nr:putative L,D-transpeptidase YbiS [Methylobacterium symbioticum]
MTARDAMIGDDRKAMTKCIPDGLHSPRPRVLHRASVLSLTLLTTGCMATDRDVGAIASVAPVHPSVLAMYAAKPTERFPLPATDVSEVDPRYFRQEVAYPRREPPGTLVVDPGNKFLYLVRENGRALRYGVGVGKAGLAWNGTAEIKRKAEWPRWTPTADMIRREPERNGPWRNGMAPGLANPLGPRALYLFDGDRDTLYRIHGTTEPDTIGTNVSSGCIRMFNQDIIDLYGRVPVSTKVVVLPAGAHVEPQEAVRTAGGDAEPDAS